MSDYRMQIVHAKTGLVVQWKAGSSVETDLINDLTARLSKRGVGLFRSEAKVLGAVRECWRELLWDLKSRV